MGGDGESDDFFLDGGGGGKPGFGQRAHVEGVGESRGGGEQSRSYASPAASAKEVSFSGRQVDSACSAAYWCCTGFSCRPTSHGSETNDLPYIL